MTTLAKVCLGVGVLGAVAGIGYAVVRYVRRKRADADHVQEPAQKEALERPEEKPHARTEIETDTSTDETDNEPVESPGHVVEHVPAPPVETQNTPKAEIPFEPGGLASAPLAEPTGANARTIITKSTVVNGTVEQSAEELLAQARKHDPAITLDELTGARLAMSELGSGSFTELACIVDAELNRAERRGMSLFQSLTSDGTFGAQGERNGPTSRKRPASTAQDPRMRHVWAARAVLSGKTRGISRGAVQFFDPRDAYRLHASYREWVAGGRRGKHRHAVTCDAPDLLEVWSFDYAKKKKNGPRCPPDRSKTGSFTLAWVGPIPGVDPWRLMLMKRMKPGQEHTMRYHAAREIILRGIEAEKVAKAAKAANAKKSQEA